jgi:predicted GH43/DUF377 family glycosyl hydrolase
MSFFERSYENPVLVPESDLPWEAEGAFNGSAIRAGKKTHLLYRAQSLPHLHETGPWLSMSSIGHTESADGIHFQGHRPFIEAKEAWDAFGCEDPRVTEIDGTYYTFYTALGGFPFGADNIKVAVALSKNFRKVSERHLVTPFNAKAMTLFPEKIRGKYWVFLTANTDLPPHEKIALASFDTIEEIWDQKKWSKWYEHLEEHAFPLQRDPEDHVEIGAQPIKTKDGWIVFYSYIQNYRTGKPVFSIEALLLDLEDPRKIIGQTHAPLLVPEEEYEMYGKVPNIVFPSGALIKGDKIALYYGAADTTTAVAFGSLKALLKELLTDHSKRPAFERYKGNPILEPITSHPWEAKAVFNPAAQLCESGSVRLFYRAQSNDDTSVFGFAESKDGYKISKRFPEPTYVPRVAFEEKARPGNSGCEDARFTKFDGTLYMFYTAVDAANPPRVAMTSISVEDFAGQHFDRFSMPTLISPPGIDDKDACLFPEKIGGKYVILHRIQPSIDINRFDDLNFTTGRYLMHNPFVFPRKGMWDSAKVGISSVPLKTEKGWVLLYHGVSADDNRYRIGVLLLDLKDPEKVLARSRYPLFEPEEPYEKEGIVPNVVFPCGSVIKDKKLFIYYGAADKVIGVATMPMKKLFDHLAV